MNVTKRMPMNIRKLHLHSLNKGNSAQYSIVKHVTKINVNSINYPMLLTLITVLHIATVQVFFAVRFIKTLTDTFFFFYSSEQTQEPLLCVLLSELCIYLEFYICSILLLTVARHKKNHSQAKSIPTFLYK